jgi:hypothetical protein
MGFPTRTGTKEMTTREARWMVILLTLSLAAGLGVLSYSISGRDHPSEIDTIWKVVERARSRIEKAEPKLEEKRPESWDFQSYQATLERMKRVEPDTEKYYLQIRSNYVFPPTTDWKPSSWDFGFLVTRTSEKERTVHLVAAKKVKEL